MKDPTDLPEEVAERIFASLALKDVVSCCAVSSQWREAVNKNFIWKQFCNLSLGLENKPCQVRPAFQMPLCETDLNPICKWRVNFMQEVHLKNNFKSNKFKEYKLSKIKNFQDKVEFLGEYLLLNDTYKNMFHVWEIENEPNLVDSVPYLLKEMSTETFQTVEGCLLIVQCNLLQVYSAVDGSFSLQLYRIFDREEEFSYTMPAAESMSSWYSANIGLYPCDFASTNEIVGNYFVGIVERFQQELSVMHIWDIKSGKKLKTEIIPGSEAVENICCGKNSECLYIILYIHSRSLSWTEQKRCKILCYSLQTLQYTHFYVESNHSVPFMLFEERVVLLPCDQWEHSGSYLFLNSTTGKVIAQKKFDNPINPKALDVYKSRLVFGSSNTVSVVDVNTQDIVTHFSVDFEVMEVYLLDGDLLLVGGVDYHFVLQVWDLKKTCKLYSLDEKSILLSGRTLLRVCFQSMYSIHIHHFW